MVLIAGPSSSGKTTSSKKLSLYLKSFGLNPKPISIDDYFLPRDKTPRLSNGEYDFESIRAIDTDLFNSQLTSLLNGEEVSLPTFNFVLGIPEFKGKKLRFGENDILIIEGLHGLNEELTSHIKRENKYKIYISPLTDLNIDNHNMVSTSDVRLLRRIVRDNRTRGYSANDTIRKWNLVREGEERYVFPFQDEADKIFNTALIYEIGVLRLYAEPLLYEIKEEDISNNFYINYSGNVKDTKIDLSPINLDNNEKKYEYTLSNPIDLANTVLSSSTFQVNSYEIKNKFTYNYTYEIDGKSFEGKKYITSPSNMILYLDITSSLSNITNYDLINNYGNILYKKDDVEYTSQRKEDKTPGNYKKGIYIEVDKNIEDAQSIWLELNIRNVTIKYILK